MYKCTTYTVRRTYGRILYDTVLHCMTLYVELMNFGALTFLPTNLNASSSCSSVSRG